MIVTGNICAMMMMHVLKTVCTCFTGFILFHYIMCSVSSSIGVMFTAKKDDTTVSNVHTQYHECIMMNEKLPMYNYTLAANSND